MHYKSLDQQHSKSSDQANLVDIENPSTQAESQDEPVHNRILATISYLSSFTSLVSKFCENGSESKNFKGVLAVGLGALGLSSSLLSAAPDDFPLFDGKDRRQLRNIHLISQGLALYFTLSNPDFNPDDLASQISLWTNVTSVAASAISFTSDTVSCIHSYVNNHRS